MENEVVTIGGIDLFCGAGGLTRGLMDAGVRIKAGVDLEETCRYPYEHNNLGAVFVHKSVHDLSADELEQYYGDAAVRLLCGCAPCQAFSSINQKNKDRASKTGRWVLLDEFGRLVKELNPELVSMENVPGLLGQDVFARFVQTLEDSNYYVDYNIIDCSDYGMPQRRKRLVLVASRFGHVSLPKPKNNKPTTVRAAIGALPSLSAGETDLKDPLHTASALSTLNMKRIQASVPGGTWNDWDESLRARCHKESSGDGYGAVYGRMEWDEPAPTITTQFYNYGSGRFGHPEQDRAISLREGALLQGFPSSYVFSEPGVLIGKRELGKLIGNAVPVGLGRLVGETLINHIKEYATPKHNCRCNYV